MTRKVRCTVDNSGNIARFQGFQTAGGLKILLQLYFYTHLKRLITTKPCCWDQIIRKSIFSLKRTAMGRIAALFLYCFKGSLVLQAFQLVIVSMQQDRFVWLYVDIFNQRQAHNTKDPLVAQKSNIINSAILRLVFITTNSAS